MCHPVTDLELDLAQLARDRGNYIDYFDCLELSTTADDMGQQYLVDRRYRHRYRIVSPKPAVTDDHSGHNNYDYQPLLHLRRLRHVEAIGKKKLAFWFNGPRTCRNEIYRRCRGGGDTASHEAAA